MSKSLSVLVLLPMDEYNSFDTYREDDRLKQIYSEVPKAENYFKTLRISSLYTSDKDLKQYFRKKYQLGKEELKNHSISYNGREYIYRFENGTTVTYTSEEDEKLKREHVEEMADVLMYYNDVLLCYEISADELKQSYSEKYKKNMERW